MSAGKDNISQVGPVNSDMDTNPDRKPKKDLVGMQFGRLTVLEYTGRTKWSAYWKCQCSCEKKTIVISAGANLLRTNRASGSCGCIRDERAKAVNQVRLKTHGMRFTKTYRCWANMKTRATNTNADVGNNYVNRGITICKRWLKFENFFEDMGECPSDDHSIDRWPNNETGGYWCGHCEECKELGRPLNARWGTEEEQARNKRSNHQMNFNGETLCIVEMAKKYNINYGTLQARVTALGWSDEKAITTPVIPRNVKQSSHVQVPPPA
jgi:hypothetical protein